MYDINNILARLANGEKPDVIAKEFTDALNGAIAEQQKQQEELARKRHEQEVRECKIQTAITAICDMLETCYPALYDPDIRKITVAEVEETMAEVVKLAGALDDLGALTVSLRSSNPTAKKPAAEKVENKAIRSADALQEFLRKNNLI